MAYVDYDVAKKGIIEILLNKNGMLKAQLEEAEEKNKDLSNSYDSVCNKLHNACMWHNKYNKLKEEYDKLYDDILEIAND